MLKELSQTLERCFSNLNKFKPEKKVPVYDQHLVDSTRKEAENVQIAINEDTFLVLFKNASEAFRKFYLHKVTLTNSTLGQILETYVSLSRKMRTNSSANF